MNWKRRSDQPQARYESDEGDTFEDSNFIDASTYQRQESDFVDASTYQRPTEQRAPTPAAEHASYEQAAVDPMFAERGRARRERQGSPFTTARLGGGGSRGGRRNFSLPLVLIPIALGAIALLGLLWFLTRGGNDDPTAIGASPSSTVVASTSPRASASPSASTSPSASASPSVSPSASASPSAAAGTYVVTGTDSDGVFVREQGSTSAAVLGTLPEGTQVQVTGVTTTADGREWRQIRAPQAGWVAADFLQPVP